MRAGRIIALVVGCLMIIPAVGMMLSGGVLGLAALMERDDDGYFDGTVEVATETAAVTAEELDFLADTGSPDWVFDTLDVDVRIRVTSASADEDIFVGIARERDLDTYLTGVSHAEVRDIDEGELSYRLRSGSANASPPSQEDFWVVSSSGSGTQEISWEAEGGRWAAVVMNADGSPGVAATTTVGARSDFVAALAISLLAAGAILTVMSVALIMLGARQSPSDARSASRESEPTSIGHRADDDHADVIYPVAVTARLDSDLSRWLWLVKWILAIPHFIVLVFLWIAFAVLTVVAGLAILFTGTYPRNIFDFNVGVLRWSWRVQFYAWSGGIGTDQYPPFSLHAEPTDPARLSVEYPDHLSRPLVLVKWLLALPHLVIIGLLAGSTVRWPDNSAADIAGFSGLLGILVLITGLILLFTDSYPKPLFDLIVGFNRWIYRVIAYVALMTDTYPPFRLDQGGTEPPRNPPLPTPPDADRIDVREGVETQARASV